MYMRKNNNRIKCLKQKEMNVGIYTKCNFVKVLNFIFLSKIEAYFSWDKKKIKSMRIDSYKVQKKIQETITCRTKFKDSPAHAVLR